MGVTTGEPLPVVIPSAFSMGARGLGCWLRWVAGGTAWCLVTLHAESVSARAESVVEPSTDLEREALREADEGRFEEAARLLGELYAREPLPKHLYARGQAQRLAGDCEAAIESLQAFVATGPPAADVTDAEHWIEVCRAQLGVGDDAPEPPPPVPPEAVDAEPPPRPWHRDPLAASLLGVGLGVAAVGGGFVGSAFVLADGSPREAQSAYVERGERAQRRAAVGWSLVGVGTSLVIGAVVRWVILRRRGEGSVALRRRGEQVRVGGFGALGLVTAPVLARTSASSGAGALGGRGRGLGLRFGVQDGRLDLGFGGG